LVAATSQDRPQPEQDRVGKIAGTKGRGAAIDQSIHFAFTTRKLKQLTGSHLPYNNTITVINKNGHGQTVQHSLLERNADWHMLRALEHLTRVNPTAAEAVQVVMVDKDLNEIRVLRSYFPKARVLICMFHVIKYLKISSRKPEYGTLSSDDHDALVHNMVYAVSAEVYEANRTSLKVLCARAGFDEFFNYMEDNWHRCIDMWVMLKRAKLPHMKIHTNNHLENWFGHFKNEVDASMSMTEAVKALMDYDARIASEYTFAKLLVGVRVNRNYDEEMSQVLLFASHFVAPHIEKQYVMASAKKDEIKYDTTGYRAGC
jgi:hypothetical protein